MPPMLPIWRSSTTRSGGSAAIAGRTSKPLATSTTRCPRPTNAARTCARTHSASAATRIVVSGLSGTGRRLLAPFAIPEQEAADLAKAFEVVHVAGEERHVRDRGAGNLPLHTREVTALALRDVLEVGEVVVERGEAAPRALDRGFVGRSRSGCEIDGAVA